MAVVVGQRLHGRLAASGELARRTVEYVPQLSVCLAPGPAGPMPQLTSGTAARPEGFESD